MQRVVVGGRALYIKVRGAWTYLYRAVDSFGRTIDFRLSPKRDAAAAKRFFRKALSQPHVVNPGTVTVDKNPAYPRAVRQLKRAGELWRFSRLRQCKCLGDPVLMLLGPDSHPTPEAIAATRHQLGLGQPVLTQYAHWLGGALQGDLGTSLDGYPVSEFVSSSMPKTIELAAAAIVIAIAIGVPIGIVAALNRARFLDGLLTSLSTLGISVPVYILGSLLIILFSLELGWLPSSGYTDISRNASLHFLKLALPALTLGLGLAASIARMTRSSMLEILGRDFVRSLRARGMAERRIVWRHVLRNAAIPIVTIVGLQLGNLMGGTVLVESLFNWPGLSTLLVTAVSNRNYPLVQGSILTIAALFILINMTVDVLYSLLDPRIRRRRV